MLTKTLTLALVAASTSAIKIKGDKPDWCNAPMYGLPTDQAWTDEMWEEYGRLAGRCSGYATHGRGSTLSHDMVWTLDPYAALPFQTGANHA